jgi:cytochrome P450
MATTVTTYGAVREVLSDARLGVPEAPASVEVGTIGWLRGAVSRFVNGVEHDRRRVLVEDQLAHLHPAQLREDTARRTSDQLAASAGLTVDVMRTLARQIPVATLAAGLGIGDEPERVAEAVMAVAAAYFPGSPPETEPAADAGLAYLLARLESGGLDTAVARISILVQACEATAALIGVTLDFLRQIGDESANWPTEALLAEALRHSSPLLITRRVALEPLPGLGADRGDVILCDVDAANRDPSEFSRPDEFDPDRQPQSNLSFGYGVRPCPGAREAMALASGVVDTVRDRCTFLAEGELEYETSPLRRPLRLEVVAQ